MELLITPVFLISVVLFVTWPLLKEDIAVLSFEDSDLDRALEEKELVISNLKDVEMDFRMGKLSTEDYEVLKGELEARAIGTLKKVDALQSKGRSKSK